MGPPDGGGRPIPIRKITNWKRVSTALEKIDTPNLNSIPMTSRLDEIDFAFYPTTPEQWSRRASGAECLADSIETQCSTLPLHDIAHISRSRKRFSKTSLEPKDDLAPERRGYRHPQARKPRPDPASYKPISLLSGSANFSRNSQTRLSDHLLERPYTIDEQFGFCPSPFLSSKSRLVSMSALTRHKTSYQSSRSSLLQLLSSAVPAYTNDVPRPSSRLASKFALSAGDTRALLRSRNRRPTLLLQRAIDELGHGSGSGG
ncbi:hypothetical protein EVAR_83969_1 [Eumeta japonica]|uniref:Uncharacterized protein n=1 Tax=Eumeta variegata TaxID=151549 RepID=A0A4C1VQ19_EUMVA|nr:hypothetical protein EVAR_83969_1 [Eumeta japonica]